MTAERGRRVPVLTNTAQIGCRIFYAVSSKLAYFGRLCHSTIAAEICDLAPSVFLQNQHAAFLAKIVAIPELPMTRIDAVACI